MSYMFKNENVMVLPHPFVAWLSIDRHTYTEKANEDTDSRRDRKTIFMHLRNELQHLNRQVSIISDGVMAIGTEQKWFPVTCLE